MKYTRMAPASSKGFSIAELIVAISVLAVIGVGVGFFITNARENAILAKKNDNAAKMNELIVQIYQAGGTISTTNAQAAITSLTNGVTVDLQGDGANENDMVFQLQGTTPTAGSYTIDTSGTVPLIASDGLTTTNP